MPAVWRLGGASPFFPHGQAVSAYAYGIDDDFRLLVRYDSGKTEALSYGEIRIQLAESAP